MKPQLTKIKIICLISSRLHMHSNCMQPNIDAQIEINLIKRFSLPFFLLLYHIIIFSYREREKFFFLSLFVLSCFSSLFLFYSFNYLFFVVANDQI